jgi:DNA topoisomerase-1
MAEDAEKPAKKKTGTTKKAPAKKEKETPAPAAKKKPAAKEPETKEPETAETKPAKKPAKKKATAKKKPAAEKKAAKGKRAKAAEAEEDEDLGPDAGAGDPEGKSLVIVESPAKAKTINKYLGKDYVVKASMGHVRDLPEKGGGLGVAIENRFAPVYKLLSEKKKVALDLKKTARESSKIFLACDNDREGEAIAWHISEILKAKPERVARITFNEITKTAIQRAIENPRQLDMAKVNAQQARRVLDRIVGYKLSPLLWAKVKRGLSAGRVQSVAVKLVVEREREIKAFLPVEYWDLEATLAKLDAPPAPPPPPPAAETETDESGEKKAPERKLGPGRFFAKLVQLGDEKLAPDKFRLQNADEAAALKKELEAATFAVSSIKKSERRDNPSPPFITSTLQQQASTRLGFATNRTMRIAQGLYEGVELGEEGAVGLITYMRTDSTNLAKEATDEARSFLRERFGGSYVPEQPPVYKSKSGAQEAHEAIRPTSALRTPESVEKFLTGDQLKLYRLIWERFVASQMPPAVFSQTTVEVTAGRALFRANGRTLIFDGHLKVSGASKKDEPILPDLAENEKLNAEKLQESQHFTQPPPRFTEASLVKALEELGIGRPSTYAAIISTIQDRGYVKQESRRLFATELGMIVTDKLAAHFHEVMDTGFTAEMESRLDRIEDEKVEWQKVLEDFYGPFEKDLAAATKAMKGVNENARESDPPVKCKRCGRIMLLKYNTRDFSRFLGCPGYDAEDKCTETQPWNEEKGAPEPDEETDETCPECGSSMVIKSGRRGRFLACSAYPNCKVTRELADDGKKQLMPELEAACPLCQKKMVVRRGRRGPFLGCTGYPDCKGTLPIVVDQETGQAKAGERGAAAPEMPKVDIKCEKCGSPMLIRRSRGGPFLGCSKYPKCRSTAQIPDEIREKLPKPPPPKELGEECDKCGKPLLIKFGRRGPFAACSGYPECKNTRPLPAGTA